LLKLQLKKSKDIYMQSNDFLEKFIKKAIAVVVVLITLLIVIYGVSTSEFANIKKYDKADDSPRMEIESSKEKLEFAKKRRYSSEVKMGTGDMANLGDFEVNVVGNRKLVMNMALKIKNNKDTGWFSSDITQKEIVKKGVVLRSTVIDTLSHYRNVDVNNPRMKEELIKNMNNYLSNGEVKEIYFNQYITHEN